MPLIRANYVCPCCGRRGVNLREAREMRRDGYTFEEIGRRFGVTRTSIESTLKRQPDEPGTPAPVSRYGTKPRARTQNPAPADADFVGEGL